MTTPRPMLTLDQVGERLAISKSQVYALVRRGDLPAGKIGGRGQWRVRADDLDSYVERTWSETADRVPWRGGSSGAWRSAG